MRTHLPHRSPEPIHPDRLLRRIGGVLLATLVVSAAGMAVMADWMAGRLRPHAGHKATVVAGYSATIAVAPLAVVTSRPFDLAHFRLEDFGDVDGQTD